MIKNICRNAKVRKYDPFFLYAALFSLMFFIQILPGLYLHDISIFLFLIILAITGKFRLSKSVSDFLSALIFLVALPIAVSLTIHALMSDDAAPYGLSAYYYIWNVALLILYICALYNLRESIRCINLSAFIFFLSFPLLLSIIAFLSDSFKDIISSLYSIDSFGTAKRYGGVYGRGIAGYGMLGFTVLYAGLMLHQRSLISNSMLIYASALSMATIFLSGIRTGLIVLVVVSSLLLLLRKKSLIQRSHVLMISLAVGLISILLHLHSPHILEDSLVRFSIERVAIDFGILDHPHLSGNVNNLLRDSEFNLNLLIGNIWALMFGSPLARHDVVYLDFVVQHGLMTLLFIWIFFLYTLLRFKPFSGKNFDHYILTASFLIFLIISLKANSAFNNYFMFTVVFLYFYAKNPHRQY